MRQGYLFSEGFVKKIKSPLKKLSKFPQYIKIASYIMISVYCDFNGGKRKCSQYV